MMERQRWHIFITGIVQGVGFRPFVYGLACHYQLAGWVYNSADGVTAEIEGAADHCSGFCKDLQCLAPPLSRIDSVDFRQIPCCEETSFIIKPSASGEKHTLISPDMGICADCLRELFDPGDRRFRYPFINCTNCGPRFTIIRDLPYDRKDTTMSVFPLCQSCAAEYGDPRNRRFHAQPNACPDCGPRLFLTDPDGKELPGDPILRAQNLLSKGKILAVKGIGGYHLCCDASNNAAVELLRSRKLRWDKPFAVMVPDLETARCYCHCSEREQELLQDQRRPIVLLWRRCDGEGLSPQLAPGNNRLGVMLPYTPLHYLLIQGFQALVMTSANRNDEPIVYRDEELFLRLSGIADYFLLHDRQIFRRCDDSVMLCMNGTPLFFRRSRGYAPEPLPFPGIGKNILAVGGEQKNTFCLVRGDQAFLSQHIGDLDDKANLEEYSGEIEDFQRMFAASAQVIACDLHPGYLSTQYAAGKNGIRCIGVQHHHAHLASVLCEHRLAEPAIGLMFDGTGYGTDGALWGGEILLGDCSAYHRVGHLMYTVLPGGEKAIHEPWRMAMSLLRLAYPQQNIEALAPGGLLGTDWKILLNAMELGINAPLCSGMGRLFDGVAALAGIGRIVHYQGQAAVELEQCMDEAAEGSYAFDILEDGDDLLIDQRPLIRQVCEDIAFGVSASAISVRFHRSLVQLSLGIASILRKKTGIDLVALSGGCWQNQYLLKHTAELLRKNGFRVYYNERVPANDGGLSLGQAAVAAAVLKKEG